MININTLKNNFKKYIPLKLSNIAANDPLISFFSPLIVRIVNNNIYKLDSFLEMLADKDGNIDIENILMEMQDNIIKNTTPFTFNLPAVGDLTIGNGSIQMGIPFTQKNLVLNMQDIEELREMLIKQN